MFWHQALAANKIYQMFDGKQRKLALCPEAPDEAEIAFRGYKGKFEGIPVAEMSKDQRAHLQKVLQLLIEPYRQTDRDEAVKPAEDLAQPTSVISPSTRRTIWATTGSGTTGGSKARPSCGTVCSP